MNSLIKVYIKKSRDIWEKLGDFSPRFTIKLNILR